MPVHENTAHADAPARKRDADIAERYRVSKRTGGEWLRRAVAAGVLRKLGGITVGRWSEMDAWVAAGGQVPERKRRR
jgi:hypothetical protein